MTSNHIVAADFVGGMLSPDERRKAEEHLKICKQCQAAVGALRQPQNNLDREQSRIFISFLANLLEGSASMLAAPLRSIPF